MRPKEPGQGLVGHRFRTRAPAGVTPAPPPTAHSAPEPSAQPAPAPAQALTAGPRTGSRSPSVSGPAPAGARPTSKAGSPTGTPRASAFAAAQRNAQFGPGNSDAQWTRFIFRGPFGPRATGLGTEKAAGIWKTPAAYIGRRPGVSGPEHAAFIRELEEGKPGPRDPRAGGTWVIPGRRRGGGGGSRRPAPSGTQSHPSTHLRCHCGACSDASCPSSPTFCRPLIAVGGSGRAPARSSARLCAPVAPQICALSRSPLPRPTQSTAIPGEGRGTAGGRCQARSERVLARRTKLGRWVGGGGWEGFVNLLAAGVEARLFPASGWAGPQVSSPCTLSWVAGDLWIRSRGSGAPTACWKYLSRLSTRNRCRVGDCVCFMTHEAPVGRERPPGKR